MTYERRNGANRQKHRRIAVAALNAWLGTR